MCQPNIIHLWHTVQTSDNSSHVHIHYYTCMYVHIEYYVHVMSERVLPAAMAYAGPEGGCAGLLLDPLWLPPFAEDTLEDLALPLPSELGLLAVGVVTDFEVPPPVLDDPLGGFDKDLLGFLGEGIDCKLYSEKE